MPPQEWDLIRSWSRQFFGSHPLSARLSWVAKERVRVRVLVHSGGQLVSHLRIIERISNLDGKDVLAGGIGAVMTAPGHHGKGLPLCGDVEGTEHRMEQYAQHSDSWAQVGLCFHSVSILTRLTMRTLGSPLISAAFFEIFLVA